MKTLSKKILIIGILITVFGILPAFSAKAFDPLVVEFQNSPLFNEANFNPGTSTDKWIKVTNNSGTAHDIAIEAINHPNPIGEYDLSRALNINIKQGSTDLYGGSLGNKTLYDFYNAGEIILSSLASNATTQYDIIVYFPKELANEWQNRTTHFDILIGFQGEEGQPSGGGGGGYIPPQGLIIVNDQVNISGVNQTTAIFEWDTSLFSTSQLIFGSDTEKHTLDLSDTGNVPPKYGYEHTTAEFDVTPMVTHHRLVVIGLTPNTTYHYRAVSHGSLAISTEKIFKTLEGTAINIETGGGGGEITPGEVAGVATSTGQINQGQAGTTLQPQNTEFATGNAETIATTVPSTAAPTFTAALGNIVNFVGNRVWLIIILILVFIGIVYFLFWFFIFKKRRKKEENPQ